MIRPLITALSLISIAALTACAPTSNNPFTKPAAATATLQPTQGSSVQGEVQFSNQQDGSVRVQGSVQGLAPNSEHGFHIHEKGDCSAPDGSSAGGHFNPANTAHARHGQGHAGDLPSLRADAAGKATFDFSTRNLLVGHGTTNVVGRGLIVHKDADDYTTQPTGNAGARLACAVITSASVNRTAN